MKFTPPSQMTVPLYGMHQHTISTAEFKALSNEGRAAYLERHDSKQDILDAAKKLVSTFNFSQSEKAFTHLVLLMDETKVADLFRFFVYAAVPLANSMKSDIRNQASAEFLKKLVACPFNSSSVNLAFGEPEQAFVSSNQDLEFIQVAIDHFLSVVGDLKKDFNFTDAEVSGVLATAILNEHPTITQSFVRATFSAGIALAGAHTSEKRVLTDTGLLTIVETFCQLGKEAYFPYV